MERKIYREFREIIAFSLLINLLFMTSCHLNVPFTKSCTIEDSYFKGIIKVVKNEKLGRYCLSIKNTTDSSTDRIFIPYEIFAMETGDVNHDGRTDICIGLIKPTPFDPVPRKRLFIFQIDRNYIRPLWLSSRLVHPLEGFKIARDKDGRDIILAVERVGRNTYCISEYKWESFGMSFVREYKSQLTLSEAFSEVKSYHENKKHNQHEI
jgi:hypothetical protein